MLFLLLPLLSSAQETPTSCLLTGGYGSSGLLSSLEVVGPGLPCTPPPLPSPLKRHTALLTQDLLVLVCGGKGADNQYSQACLVLEAGTWRLHSSLLHQREYSTGVTLPSGSYLLGGSGSAQTSIEWLPTGH